MKQSILDKEIIRTNSLGKIVELSIKQTKISSSAGIDYQIDFMLGNRFVGRTGVHVSHDEKKDFDSKNYFDSVREQAVNELKEFGYLPNGEANPYKIKARKY